MRRSFLQPERLETAAFARRLDCVGGEMLTIKAVRCIVCEYALDD